MSNNDLIIDVFSILKESERFCFLTRDEEFQKQSIENLKSIKSKISEEKEKAISEKDEKNANIFLSAEFIVEALISELGMWVELKNRDYSKAWDSLVESQSNLRHSSQASADAGFNFDGYSYKLSLIEKVIFPKPMFMSPGMIIESTKCSICGKNYDECDHLIGKAYMGKLCYQIVDKIKEIKEISIVEEPANKHARITNFTENGITRDLFTWKEIKEEEK